MADPIATDPPNSGSDAPTIRRARIPFTLQEKLFIFCCLMIVTCLFLPWRSSDTEVSPWKLFSSFDSVWTTAPAVVLLILDGVTLWSVSRPRLRPWFGIVTAIAVLVTLAAVALLPGNEAYGANLARLFALGLLVLSANPAIAKAGDLTMRQLNSRDADVFTHWGAVIPGIHFSAQDFYAKVEAEVRAREWPGVEFLRVPYTEAGLLSYKREYLRVVRQRQVFDLCASTFGKDYFFSVREAEIRAELTLATAIIFLLALWMVLSWCLSTFGLVLGTISFGQVLALGVLLLWNVLRMGLTRLDGLLMRTPVIGPIYETWFRRSTTYFQHDTRVVFLKLMDELVKTRVDEETSGKGVQLLSCFEHQPIFDGFYKATSHDPKGGDEK